MVLGWRALGNRFSLGHLVVGGSAWWTQRHPRRFSGETSVGDGPFLLLMILVLNGHFCNANRNEQVFFEKKHGFPFCMEEICCGSQFL